MFVVFGFDAFDLFMVIYFGLVLMCFVLSGDSVWLDCLDWLLLCCLIFGVCYS